MVPMCRKLDFKQVSKFKQNVTKKKRAFLNSNLQNKMNSKRIGLIRKKVKKIVSNLLICLKKWQLTHRKSIK